MRVIGTSADGRSAQTNENFLYKTVTDREMMGKIGNGRINAFSSFIGVEYSLTLRQGGGEGKSGD